MRIQILSSFVFTAALLAQDAPKAQPAAPADAQAKPSAEKAEIGKPVGAITLRDIDGKEHALASHKGKVVVIDFWSHKCPISRAYEDEREGLRAEFEKDDVVFVAVDPNGSDLVPGEDPYSGIREYVKKQNVRLPILIDEGHKIADRFGAETTPHVFILDREQKLVYAGGIDSDVRNSVSRGGEQPEPWAKDAIRAVLDGKPVAAAKTENWGCSIKRGTWEAKGGEAQKGRRGEGRGDGARSGKGDASEKPANPAKKSDGS